MKTIALTFIAALFTGIAAAQEMPKPQKEHEWLRQLTGEWDTEGEVVAEPGKPPTKTKGSESNRSIGGFWILSEHKGEFAGTSFTGILSLGYSPEKKKYIGTWMDSLGSYLWSYQGTVDETGKILTLETEGPTPDGKTGKFREVLTVKDKDHKEFSSSMEKDGKWVTYLKIQYTRKK